MVTRRPSPGRPAGQYTQAVRLFQLYHLLESATDGVKIDDIARELGVTARSIRRDLKALEVAQLELENVEIHDERRVRIKRTGRTTEPIRLTRFQKFSLNAVRRVFDVLVGTPFHDDLSQVFTKLAPVGEDEGAALGDRFVYIPEAPKNYRRQKDQLYDIYDGVLRSLTLQFNYEGGTAPGGRKVEPYALVLYRNGLYVVGRDVQKDAPRTFAVERMKRVRTLTTQPFKRDPSFDVSHMFDGAFGLMGGTERYRVVVDFSPRVVRWIQERDWHPSQQFQSLPDGGIRMELEVTNLQEIVTWVLSWGAAAVVREPPVLVQRLREEHLRASQQYDSAPSALGAAPSA
ncbi:MAG: transcriptional regulator [Deltaproteobacteria bacterium]|nr:transcriptional regulator [Deltaproteobacteria bacterium]